MPDDYDEIIDIFKKMFNLESDNFEVDFLFIPESDIKLDPKRKESNIKGFKISYHFETGMEKPEIKIEGKIDENKIRKHLKDIDLNAHPNLKKLIQSKIIEVFDADKLSLDNNQQKNDLDILTPYTEIIDKEDSSEFIFEIPGMEKDNVSIDFTEEGRKLIFSAEKRSRKYNKKISLPFKSSKTDYELEVNNGLAVLKVHKTEK